MESLRLRMGTCLTAVLIAAALAGPVRPLRGQNSGVPELRPPNSGPINLRIINQTPGTLYDTIGKVAGIDVVWVPEAKAQSEKGRFTVEMSKATIREALDKVASVTKTSWKPVSATSISVGLP